LIKYKFRKVAEAHEILSNPDKKELYDRYGMDGVKEGTGNRGDFGDIFNMFGMKG